MRLTRIGGAALLIAAPSRGAAQHAPKRSYANPIDIDYRYNFEQQNQGISYCSGADPVIVVQRGKYYLFATIGDGYWESSDLGTWRQGTTLELRALTVGQGYWFAIESFDENGVSKLSPPLPIR